MASFDEVRFRRKVDSALIKVRQILDRTRHPLYAADVNHCYQDKFSVAEFLVKAALASNLNTLHAIGMTEEIIRKLIHWSKCRRVSLRFRCEEKCTFDHQATRNENFTEKDETRVRCGSFESLFSTKVVTTITEYFWNFEGQYQLVAFCGVGSCQEDQQLVLTRAYKHQIVTRAKSNPRFERKQYDDIDVDITWFLTRLNPDDLKITFSIDRESPACRTPRRNRDVDKILESVRRLHFWCQMVRQHVHDNIFSVWSHHELDLSAINTHSIFVPVLPLLEDTKPHLALQHDLLGVLTSDSAHTPHAAASRDVVTASPATAAGAATSATDAGAVTLRPTDLSAFLAEQQRTVAQRRADVSKLLPPAESGKVISAAEGRLLVCLEHMGDVAEHLVDGLGYVEDMLRKQLVAAVGRVVGPADFAAYMRFHGRRLFLAEFEPRPFCFAVRRSARHSPEGHVTIEEAPAAGGAAGMPDPVYTVVRSAAAGPVMEFALSAATSVRFGGERHVHAWMRHSFAGQSPTAEVFLGAQARQFSGFIVLVGTIASARVFEPKYGMIVQNKDDMRIPLMLETLPSPKEFKDAIQSLSPEQQAFARAFRSMQLASTLFAVCVIQIKPQLERLLNLPPESLTKEIKLTQDLTELFIKYQIPADLLTCGPIVAADGGEDAAAGNAAAKVAEVKRHVQAMQELIEAAKRKQLEEKAQQAAYSALSTATHTRPSWSSSPSSSATSSSSDAAGYEGSLECKVDYDQGVRALSVCSDKAARRQYSASALAALEAKCRAAPLRQLKLAPPPAAPPRGGGPVPAPPAPPPAPAPAAGQAASPPARQTRSPAARKECRGPAAAGRGDDGDGAAEDYTELPGVLDRRFEALDVDAAVRPTTIRPGEAWSKRSVASLLSGSADTATVGAEGQREERGRAFELLDGLTRGGALGLEECSLHVVLAATHGFDKGVVDTVIEDGVNPIDKAERSALIMASAVAGRDPAEMVKAEQLPRLRGLNPALFGEA